MTGGSKPKAIQPPPTPAPIPMPEEGEVSEAKKTTRRRIRGMTGRESTILAGRLMSERGKTLLGE